MDPYYHSSLSLHDLLENQIPDEIKKLENSSSELVRVAAHCDNIFYNAANKKAAFEETKRYTNQSLAGIAYQVNIISSALLRSLELESESIASKLNDVNNTSQELDIQKEKAARQEIGKLTINKNIKREDKITYPEKKPKQKRHHFVDVDFSALDQLGHGVQEHNHKPINVNRTNSILSGSETLSSHGGHQNYDFLMPRGQSTLTRKSVRSDTNSVYRIPQVPNMYSDLRYSSSSAATMRASLYPENGSTGHRSVQYSDNGSGSANRSILYSDSGSVNYGSSNRSTVGAPSQLGSVSQYRLSMDSAEGLPPPPLSLIHPMDEPMPPPPFADEIYYGQNPDLLTPTPDWIPPVYIEKARALYDYDAEKADELNLREDCLVYIVAKNDDGWFEGVVDGITGLFPSNYVQKI